MNAIEDIKQKLDIVEIAGQYTRLVKAGKNFKGTCPFHQEKHASFFVFPDKQTWHCFGACSTGGDVFSLVMKKEGLAFTEAFQVLAGRAGVPLPQRGTSHQDKQKLTRLFDANEAAELFYNRCLIEAPEAQAAREYMLKRGINSASLAAFKLGFSLPYRDKLKSNLLERGFNLTELIDAGLVMQSDNESHDRFRNRLMFPIHNSQGKVVGFGAREMDGSQPKYINSPETSIFDKSSILFGLDLAKEEIRNKDVIIVVEGYLDAIIARQYGFYNTVAAMGTAISRKQIALIRKLTSNLVLAMDADEAGEKAMLRVVDFENEMDNEIKVVMLPAGKDPDEVIRGSVSDWQQLLDSATPLIEFAFDRARKGLDLNSARGKSSLVDKMLPVIVKINNPVRQAHYLQQLSRVVKVDQARLEASIKQMVIKGKIREEGHEYPPSPKDKSIFYNPREEYCLAILIQYPEYLRRALPLQTEYFSNSENAEIYNLISACDSIDSVRGQMDDALLDHYNHLLNISIIPDNIEHKLDECILLLKDNYYRNLLRSQEEILSLPETTPEEREVLLQEEVKINRHLKTVFMQKSNINVRMRREKASDEIG